MTLIEAARAALAYIEETPAKLWPAGTLHRITINLRTALAAHAIERAVRGDQP